MRRRDERGSGTLELVVLTPALLLIISVIIFGGRVAIAGQAVQQAADQAAREASISRSVTGAKAAATSAATNTLSQQDLECVSMTVDVDVSGFNAPIGVSSSVIATVTCSVKVAGLKIPGVPAARTVKATARSPIDQYRER